MGRAYLAYYSNYPYTKISHRDKHQLTFTIIQSIYTKKLSAQIEKTLTPIPSNKYFYLHAKTHFPDIKFPKFLYLSSKFSSIDKSQYKKQPKNGLFPTKTHLLYKFFYIDNSLAALFQYHLCFLRIPLTPTSLIYHSCFILIFSLYILIKIAIHFII